MLRGRCKLLQESSSKSRIRALFNSFHRFSSLFSNSFETKKLCVGFLLPPLVVQGPSLSSFDCCARGLKPTSPGVDLIAESRAEASVDVVPSERMPLPADWRSILSFQARLFHSFAEALRRGLRASWSAWIWDLPGPR